MLLLSASYLVQGWDGEPPISKIQYTRDFLLGFNNPTNISPPSDLVFPNLEEFDRGSGKRGHAGAPLRKVRKRGRRGGIQVRARRQPLARIALPSIILANARSLHNKIDDLQAHVRYQHEFKEACILALTETWFGEKDLDSEMTIDGFGAPLRTDREAAITGKSRGGGVCLYINERWCKNFIVRASVCTKDIELLSVSMCPPYLPREFPQIFVTVVYIHPKANESSASELILQTVQKLQSLSPDAPNVILGDFNHYSLNKILKGFYKYISCPTRYGKTLDQCYGLIKGAYKSIPLPPLGTADHNCVHLIPAYRTCLQRGKVLTKRVKLWSEDAVQELQGCLDCTVWEEFITSSRDLDELTDIVSSWISYCEDTVIPDREVKIYPNSKLWVSKHQRWK